MAAVDSLLRLLESQNAESLTLAPGEVPRLVKAGAAQPLSMPPLGPAVMITFVDEVLTPAERDQVLAGATVTAAYPPGDGPGGYVVTAKPRSGGLALTFKRRPARPLALAGGVAAGGGVGAPSVGATALGGASARSPGLAGATSVASSPGVASVVAEPGVATALSAAGSSGVTAPPSVAPLAPAPPHSANAASGGPAPLGPPSPFLQYLVRVAEDDASDLVLSSGRPVRARIAGQWHELSGPAPDDASLWALFEPALSATHVETLRRTGACDLPFTLPLPGRRLRFRVNLFRQHGGLAAALRPVRRQVPTLDALGLPDALRSLVSFVNGLVLVTGPTGSGKSTTLVALVEHLNRETAKHVVTLEDPVEYEYTPQRSLIHQRELGAHIDTFESGLRAALREAPDVILLGEMRDRATIAAALTAAQTGHLVLSSLHASSAAMAVDRIVDVFPEHQQRQVRSELAASLRAVLTQVLVPAKDGERLPAIELCVVTSAVAALVREDRTHQIESAIQTGRDDGMIRLDRSLAELVASGRVELGAAIAVTRDGGVQLSELLRGMSPARGAVAAREVDPRPSGRGPYR